MLNDNLAETLLSLFSDVYNKINDDNDRIISLQEICELTSSKRVFADEYTNYGIPFYRGGEITLKQSGKPITDPLYISEQHYQELKEKYGVPQLGDILLTAVGTIGNSYLVQNEKFYFKDGNIIWLKNFSNPDVNYYIYDYLKSHYFKMSLEGICIGSTQTALTIAALSKLKVAIPINEELYMYSSKSKMIHNAIDKNNQEIERLHILQNILLSKLSR